MQRTSTEDIFTRSQPFLTPGHWAGPFWPRGTRFPKGVPHPRGRAPQPGKTVPRVDYRPHKAEGPRREGSAAAPTQAYPRPTLGRTGLAPPPAQDSSHTLPAWSPTGLTMRWAWQHEHRRPRGGRGRADGALRASRLPLPAHTHAAALRLPGSCGWQEGGKRPATLHLHDPVALTPSPLSPRLSPPSSSAPPPFSPGGSRAPPSSRGCPAGCDVTRPRPLI